MSAVNAIPVPAPRASVPPRGVGDSAPLTAGASRDFLRRPQGSPKAVVTAAGPQYIPARILRIRDEVVAISKANTTNLEGIPETRAQLEPKLEELAAYFRNNRPVNELELIRGSWRNVWMDDADILAAERFSPIDRTRVFQVVEDGYYVNVSETSFRGLPFIKLNSYLRGAYTVIPEASPDDDGNVRRNVFALQFTGTRARLGRLPEGESIRDRMLSVENGDLLSIPAPGPTGVRGELWNLYLDDEVRISAGKQEGDPDVTDIFILVRDDAL